ncbi:unnamed protein product, partial [Allacma fusca]
PATVTTDFEQALINAFTQKFPTSRHQGCFFHFTQCIWRKIQALPGTCKEYKSNDLFAQNIKTLAALAFLPVKDVVFGFELEPIIPLRVGIEDFLRVWEASTLIFGGL